MNASGVGVYCCRRYLLLEFPPKNDESILKFKSGNYLD
jgi:DNA-directed RNA polymerase subunit N (RpoN/RPB10)